MNAVPATTEKYTSLSPSPLSGGRRRHMKKVSAKTIRKTLKRLGMKAKGRVVLKGGAEEGEETETPSTPTAGRRHRRRHTKKTHRRGRKSLFGLRY